MNRRTNERKNKEIKEETVEWEGCQPERGEGEGLTMRVLR